MLSALSLAAKAIAAKVRRARIEDVLGEGGAANVHGETQQKLDVIANDILMQCLGSRPTIACVASEENEEPTILKRGVDGGKYCVVFDPLDGSSNLDVCVGVGTIFSILRNDPSIAGAVETLCQTGTCQVAAGYILYGSSTVFVLTTGQGVDMFVLDPSIGSFVLVERGVRIPESGKTYSVNEANQRDLPCRVSAISRLGARRGILEPVHRFDGRRRAPDIIKGRRVSVSADAQEPGRQAPAPVRSESDGDDRRTGRRHGDGARPRHAVGAGAHPRRSSRRASISGRACVLGSPREVEHVLRYLENIA